MDAAASTSLTDIAFAGRTADRVSAVKLLQLAQSDEIDITLCSLDQPDSLTPEDHTWVSSRLPWVKVCYGLPEHPRTRPG